MGVSTFSRRLLKRLRERSPEPNRRRRPAPLSVRGLERRIVLDATIATGGGSVDITLTANGTNLDLTRETFNIDGNPGAEDVYRFSMNSGSWNGGASGQIDLDGAPGGEAFISGKDLYVSAAFLESNAGGLSVLGPVANPGFNVATNITTAGNQDYGVRVALKDDVTLTGSTVTFTDRVVGANHDLRVDGNAVFGNSSGDTVTGLDVLIVSGTAAINTNTVATDGTQTYTGAVTIGATAGTATLTTSDDAVLFGSSLSLNSNLTINAGTGGVTFTGTVNGGKTLVVNSTGATVFNGLVGGATPLTSLTTNAGGSTQINGGGIHTTGNQLYNDDVRLGAGTQAVSGNTIHFFERVDGLAAGQGSLVIANTNSVLFDKAVGSVNDLASFQVSATDITFGTATFVDVTGSTAQSVHIVATGTLTLPTGFTVRAAYNGVDYDGVANSFTPRPSPGVADTALVELPGTPPTFTSTANPDGSNTTSISLTVGNPAEKGLKVFVDWGSTSAPANRYEGPDGWADGDGSGANNGKLDALGGASTTALTHTYTAGEVAAQQLIDNTFDVKYAVFQHEAIVIEAARLQQAGETPLGVAGGPLIALTTTMLYANPADPRFEPPAAASNPNLTNGLVFVQVASAPPPFGGGSIVVGGGSVDLYNFISGTTVTVTQQTFDINGDSVPDDVYAFTLNTGTWNDGVANLAGPVDLNGVAGAEAFVNGGILYVSKNFLETNAGGMSITGNGIDPTIILNTNINTVGDQDYKAEVQLATDVTLNSGTRAVTFADTVTGPHALVIQASGNTSFQGAVSLASLTTDSAGQTRIGAGVGTITTSGTMTFNDNVFLLGDVLLTGTVVTMARSVGGGGHDLSIVGNAVLGTTSANGLIGMGAVSVTGTTLLNVSSVSSGATQFYGGDVTLGSNETLTGSQVTFGGNVIGGGKSLTISGNAVFGDSDSDTVTGLSALGVSGQTTIEAGLIQSTGAQIYSGPVTLASDVTVNSGAGAVTFGNTVSGPYSLSIQSTGITKFQGAVNLQSLTTNTGGQTQFDAGVGTITTTAEQTYGDFAILNGDIVMTGSLVSFERSVLGNNHNLSIVGDAILGSASSNGLIAMGTVSVSGTTMMNVGSVSSSGTQTYGGDVTLGSNVTLSGSQVTFLSGVIGGGKSLTVDGDAVFGDAAGDSVTGLSTLEVTGSTRINTSTVTTSGSQKFDGPVTIGATAGTATLTTADSPVLFGSTVDLAADLTVSAGSGDATFTGVVNGGFDLIVNSAGTTTFYGEVGGVTALASVTTNAGGTTDINGGGVHTTGAQLYLDDVELSASTTLSASLVTFDGKLDGAGHALQITGNAVFGDAAGDTVTGLTTLLVTGTAEINTNTVTTSGTQTYQSPVTIGSPAGTATLTTTNSAVSFEDSVSLLSNLTVTTGFGPVTFSDEVDGPWDLVVDTAGNTTFSAAVGSTTPLNSLTTNAGGTTFLNGGGVTTQLNQTYGDHVVLGTNTTLTSFAGVVTFLGTVAGNAKSLEINGNAVFGDEAGDTVTGLASLSVSGTTTINTSTVTSSGSQTFTGAVTIGAPAGLVTLTTTNSQVEFGSKTTLQSDLTVTTGSGNISWGGAIDGAFDLLANTTGTTIFNGPVGEQTKLASVTTNAGGTTQINGGGVHTTGNQLYGDNIEVGPGTQLLDGDVIHFFGGVDGRNERLGDLNITSANAVFFDQPIGALRDPGSIKVHAVDITFAAGTFIEVGKSAAESVHIVATGTLVLPTGFVVRAAYNGGAYDGVANTFVPRPAPGVLDTALVELPKDRPIFSSKQNLDQSSTGTIELTIGNTGERGLRVFVDWGNTVSQDNRFEGPGGWADGDGLGDNTAPGDLYAIEGGSTVSLTHTYTEAEVQAQLLIDNDFDVKYAVYQHEAIVIEAARVEQGRESLGTPGGPMTVLTTTMIYQNAADPLFEPPPPATVPDLVNGTAAIQLSPGSGGVPFDFPVQRPELSFVPINDVRPLEPLVTFQQVTKDESSASAPVVGREQRFVLRLLSPDPTAAPLAEVELPPDSFQADRLQKLFKELPDGAYEIDLILGENTERPILRFDIRQGRPVVPQESLDGGQLRLEDIQDTLKKHSEQPQAPAPAAPVTDSSSTEETDAFLNVDETSESIQTAGTIDADEGNSSQPVRAAGTISSRLEWQLRRRAANREDSLTLASRLARRLNS